MVEWCLDFLCIFHHCMAIGRLQVALTESCIGEHPKEKAEVVQRVQYRLWTSVDWGASAAPDGEEARARNLAWVEIRPLLACDIEDGEWQAVVAMCDLLRYLYTETPH